MTATDGQIFEAVADALVGIDIPDQVKRQILITTMDNVGVPMMSIYRYRDDKVILELFSERGVRLVDVSEDEAASAAALADTRREMDHDAGDYGADT